MDDCAISSCCRCYHLKPLTAEMMTELFDLFWPTIIRLNENCEKRNAEIYAG